MRTTALGILIGIFALAFSGCGGAQSDADGRVTVTFWHSFPAGTIPALEELVKRFEDEHPGIRLNAQYIPTGDALVQKLVTAVQSGTAPDVSWIHSHYVSDLVKADAIYEMAEFVDGPNGLTEEEMADIYPALLQYGSWQGTLYSMPMEATNLGILYNKDHFREVGLDPERPPKDWDELREYARRLSGDRDSDGKLDRVGFVMPVAPATGPQGSYMMWTWIPFLWQAGGYLINLEQTEVLFDEAAGVEALGFWQDLYQTQNLRSFNTVEPLTSFVSGQVSMMLDGPWNLPRYPRMLPDTDWGIAMLPAGPAQRSTVVAGEYLAIFKQSEHPEETWTFVKWMVQPEVQAFWSIESGYLPVRKSSLEIEEYRQFLRDNPGHRVFAEQMEYAQAQRPMDFYPVEIQRHLANAIEQALVGGEDPAQVLERAARASNELLDGVPPDQRRQIAQPPVAQQQDQEASNTAAPDTAAQAAPSSQ